MTVTVAIQGEICYILLGASVAIATYKLLSLSPLPEDTRFSLFAYATVIPIEFSPFHLSILYFSIFISMSCIFHVMDWAGRVWCRDAKDGFRQRRTRKMSISSFIGAVASMSLHPWSELWMCLDVCFGSDVLKTMHVQCTAFVIIVDCGVNSPSKSGTSNSNLLFVSCLWHASAARKSGDVSTIYFIFIFFCIFFFRFFRFQHWLSAPGVSVLGGGEKETHWHRIIYTKVSRIFHFYRLRRRGNRILHTHTEVQRLCRRRSRRRRRL